MLKPSLQLKLGQQLTMTPQLQQAIRLLQLPALELQAHIRELLETQRHARADGGGRGAPPPSRPWSRPPAAAQARPSAPRRARSRCSTRAGASTASGRPRRPGAAMTTSGSRSSPTPPGSRCRSTCCGSSSSRSLAPRELAIARAIVDAISDDGYLTESLEEIAQTLRPEIECAAAEVAAVLARRAGARPARRRRALGRRVHRAAAAPARSRHPGLRDRGADRAPPSRRWSPSASCRCCAASCAPPKRSSPRRWRWCAPAIPRPGATVSAGSGGVRRAGCVRAPHRARLGGGDQPRHAAARAPQPQLRQPHRPQPPATRACARSCRKRAGC